MSWMMRCVRDGGFAAGAAVATICAVAQPVATPAAPPVTVPAPTPLVTTQVPTTLPTALLPVVVQGFECRSDDPGWRLDANRTSAQFDLTTSKGRREVVFRGALQPLTQTPQLVVWRGDSTHLPRETLVVTVREEACRGTATHRAVLSVKAGEAMMGCCTMRAGYDARVAPAAVFAAKGPADWARLLPDLLPAINLCVAREGGRARWISRAAPTAQGMAVVRVVETSGAVVDCTADLAGRGTPKVDPVRATDPPPANAGNPLFYPPREPPPMVSCGKLERVVTKSGALSGYLHYDPC